MQPLLASLYRESLALLTDLYQITMAYGYWKEGRAELEAAFHLYFRTPPFGGGFTLACGMGPAIEMLESLRFTPSDLAYLEGLRGDDGSPLFEPAFLDHLGATLDGAPPGDFDTPWRALQDVYANRYGLEDLAREP